MTNAKYFNNLKGYLTRAEKLLYKGDDVSICYCALELRKAIELVVWSQFNSAFRDIINYKTSYSFYDFIFSTQSQSISKMYGMLKKYSHNYVEEANKGTVTIYSEGTRNIREIGKCCFIPTELPNNDYDYLSKIIHYEKEFLPPNFKIDKDKLREIYKRLIFIQNNYTFPIIPIILGKEKEIIEVFKNKFNLKTI